jgi:broad specificity phosphatase PhoE
VPRVSAGPWMTTFALIRHAAHGLLGDTIIGRTPGIAISPHGLQEAEQVAARLAASRIGAVYSSPLERARRTAEVIAARLALEVQMADELNELDFGDWTDRKLSDLHAFEEWRRFNRFRSGSRIPNGEAMIEVQCRVLRLIERLCTLHPAQMVALVSHGDVIKATLAHYLGVPLDLFQRIEISPASVSIVRIEPDGPQVLLVNGLVEDELLHA